MMMGRPGSVALAAGMVLLALLSVAAVLGPVLTADPSVSRTGVHYADTSRGRELQVPPLPPSPAHPFGTDTYGYDILTLILRGARYTLGMSAGVALLRVLLGLGLAMVMGPRGEGRSPTGLLAGLSSVPSFIIIYFVLYGINFNNPLGPLPLSLLQGALFLLFGLFGVVPVIQKRMAELEGRSFVEAARSCGAGRLRILGCHVLPHLKEPLVILFGHELMDVLVLMGKLGIFNMFVGGTLMTTYPVLYHSKSHEWAGLVGQYRSSLYGNDIWSLLFPLCGYLTLLLSYYLLSRGLEARYRRVYRLAAHL
jgi:peptide/nickel transport system permease protein